jgi:hypothetical protein
MGGPMNFMNFVNVVLGLVGERVLFSSLLRSLVKLIEKKRFRLSPRCWSRPGRKFMKFTSEVPWPENRQGLMPPPERAAGGWNGVIAKADYH